MSIIDVQIILDSHRDLKAMARSAVQTPKQESIAAAAAFLRVVCCILRDTLSVTHGEYTYAEVELQTIKVQL